MNDTYYSIAGPSEGLFRDRGSRFISLMRPVECEAEARALLEKARADWHDARHHCLAYRIGLGGEVWRASDDGEPSGSAGRQILSRLEAAGLSDVAVVVVRYFGGIKLGIPGLIRAYRESTDDAVRAAVRVEKVAGEWMRLKFGYGAMPEVMKAVKAVGATLCAQDFGTDCAMEARIRLSRLDDFLEMTKNIPTFRNEII